MIFLTVGTERWPFDRLLKIIDSAIERKEIREDVFGQTGHSDYKPRFFRYEKILDFDRFIDMVRRSRMVVSHAGAGSLILCLRMGKIPLMFPRNAAHGEHLNDHQVDLAK